MRHTCYLAQFPRAQSTHATPRSCRKSGSSRGHDRLSGSSDTVSAQLAVARNLGCCPWSLRSGCGLGTVFRKRPILQVSRVVVCAANASNPAFQRSSRGRSRKFRDKKLLRNGKCQDALVPLVLSSRTAKAVSSTAPSLDLHHGRVQYSVMDLRSRASRRVGGQRKRLLTLRCTQWLATAGLWAAQSLRRAPLTQPPATHSRDGWVAGDRLTPGRTSHRSPPLPPLVSRVQNFLMDLAAFVVSPCYAVTCEEVSYQEKLYHTPLHVRHGSGCCFNVQRCASSRPYRVHGGDLRQCCPERRRQVLGRFASREHGG